MINTERTLSIDYLIRKNYKAVYKLYKEYKHPEKADFLDLIELIVSTKGTPQHKEMLEKIKEEIDNQESLKEKQEEQLTKQKPNEHTDFLEIITFQDQYGLDTQKPSPSLPPPIPPYYILLTDFIKKFNLCSQSTVSRKISEGDFAHYFITSSRYYIQPEELLLHFSRNKKNSPLKRIAIQFLSNPILMQSLYQMMGKKLTHRG